MQRFYQWPPLAGIQLSLYPCFHSASRPGTNHTQIHWWCTGMTTPSPLWHSEAGPYDWSSPSLNRMSPVYCQTEHELWHVPPAFRQVGSGWRDTHECANTYSSGDGFFYGARETGHHSKPSIVENVHGHFKSFPFLWGRESYQIERNWFMTWLTSQQVLHRNLYIVKVDLSSVGGLDPHFLLRRTTGDTSKWTLHNKGRYFVLDFTCLRVFDWCLSKDRKDLCYASIADPLSEVLL